MVGERQPTDPARGSTRSEDVVPGGVARLDVLKALGDNTRYAIYLELARSPSPLTTTEIAATIGLHPNTVRPHLERMRDVGLVEVSADGRGAIGRPQHRYTTSPNAPSLGFEPPVMPSLARMVVELADRLGAAPDDARVTGAAEGAERAHGYGDSPSTLEALVDDLDRLGFDPVVIDGADGIDVDNAPQSSSPIERTVVGFANCPYGDLAYDHPDIVCSLHHGIIEGFVESLGDTGIAEFNSCIARTPCQVTLAG